MFLVFIIITRRWRRWRGSKLLFFSQVMENRRKREKREKSSFRNAELILKLLQTAVGCDVVLRSSLGDSDQGYTQLKHLDGRWNLFSSLSDIKSRWTHVQSITRIASHRIASFKERRIVSLSLSPASYFHLRAQLYKPKHDLHPPHSLPLLLVNWWSDFSYSSIRFLSREKPFPLHLFIAVCWRRLTNLDQVTQPNPRKNERWCYNKFTIHLFRPTRSLARSFVSNSISPSFSFF